MKPDVIDAIEDIAASEIAKIHRLNAEDPDAVISDSVIERLEKLQHLVTEARKEWREQKKFVAKLPDKDVGL